MEKIRKKIKELEISNDEDICKKLEIYSEDLMEKRKWGQLVSKKFEDKSEEMINDTLMLIDVIGKKGKERIVDIGSGGGIVGIPLSITCNEMEITMIERSKRKCAFLAEEIRKLEIRNALVICKDAREVIGKELFDISITRGVGKIEDTIEVALGLLEHGGRYITIKGSEAEEETDKAEEIIRNNGGMLVDIERKYEEEEYRERTAIVVIEKVM